LYQHSPRAALDLTTFLVRGRRGELKLMAKSQEAPSDQATPHRKRAPLDNAEKCAEGEALKRQYDSALQVWKMLSIPPVDPLEEGTISAAAASQRREETLNKRNEAANNMYLHRATCSLCRRRR
jgi:hypothetical protein